MNSGVPPPTSKTAPRSSGYHQKALAEIRNSLLPFANTSDRDGGSSAASTVSSGVGSVSGEYNPLQHSLGLLLAQGYEEELALRALRCVGGRYDQALEILSKSQDSINGLRKGPAFTAFGTKLNRKPSLERELNLHRGSPALDSGAGSSRSDSPRLTDLSHDKLTRQYSPSNFGDTPPPPPPRCTSTPPPLPPHAVPAVPASVQQLLKRMSPAPVPPARGVSPVASGVNNVPPPSSGRQPMIVQNGPQVQQQLSQQMQALIFTGNNNTSELPPPYPNPYTPPPPPYSISIQNRQSPTQSQDYRKSPSAIYTGTSSVGSPSPITVSQSMGQTSSMARPTPLQAWGARQAKTQPPIIMQSVKSTQVQKPILQTAIAPPVPQPVSTAPTTQVPPPSYASSIQQKQNNVDTYSISPKPPSNAPSPTTPPASGTSPLIPTTEPPSYAITMQALAVQRGIHHQLPPPPYGNQEDVAGLSNVQMPHSAVIKKFPVNNTDSRSESPQSTSSNDGQSSSQYPCIVGDKNIPPLPPTASSSVNSKALAINGSSNNDHSNLPPCAKIRHQSPIPERKHMSREKEDERRDGIVRNYSPQAYKFFMEQHVENVIKSYKQRMYRKFQLEKEMTKIGLSQEAQSQIRLMLSQKESNYIRLKRAKMDKSMFIKIKTIGLGAFGEVALVRKIDTNHVYAMKTLRKSDVLKRNQVAHVKAERDILAEADNEWVVKLYYSFQDKDYLYFVMDYIPGGDLMSLLIKLGIFEEHLARFYIAELTCAVESVHKMGFIHRDIKPDNILIDRDGHIKLTDFGLCTGFRWTHNSKYYQRNGEHGRQDSMEPTADWQESEYRSPPQLKPLERRRQLEHQRCLAHSLVGTPNYIAPEVLQRTGYTQLCDWWSVGVILYEMLVGAPPFSAATPAETQRKVINWKTTLHIPKSSHLSYESTDLILRLCSDADNRLGKDAAEVKGHPFFKKVDFDKGLRKQVAPHIPRLECDIDTSNFDEIDPDKLRKSASSDSNKSDNELLDNGKPFHGFFEFTFRRFFDGGGPVFNNRISLDNENDSPVYV